MEDRTDSQLIAAYLAGDDASLELLYTRHLRPLYGFVRRIVGPGDAEDVAQDAFVRAWKHLDAFESGKSFKAWLYRIAHNAAVDFLKKKRPAAFSDYENDSGVDLADVLEDPLPHADEIFDKAIEASMIRALLDKLPDKSRLVLTLRYVDDLTFAEIGVTLGEPLDTVKSRMRRTLITLKKMLDSGQDAPK